MAQRDAVLDQSGSGERQTDALGQANRRAERAEAELARLKNQMGSAKKSSMTEGVMSGASGLDELRKDSMMAHLLDSLEAGKDIGHYGRLVFSMVARHFLAQDEVLRYLTRDKDFSEEQAVLMLRQVEGRDYNPPRRERILEWQSEQSFPILPNPEDPDCGNLYRNFKFPEAIYDHIGHYQEEKLQAGE